MRSDGGVYKKTGCHSAMDFFPFFFLFSILVPFVSIFNNFGKFIIIARELNINATKLNLKQINSIYNWYFIRMLISLAKCQGFSYANKLSSCDYIFFEFLGFFSLLAICIRNPMYPMIHNFLKKLLLWEKRSRFFWSSLLIFTADWCSSGIIIKSMMPIVI